MREILFRGKCIEDGKWVTGEYLLDIFNSLTIVVSTKTGTKSYYNIIPETVGQYTGLINTKNKKIFEGDIIKTRLGTTSIGFDECRGFGGYSNRKRKDKSLIYLCGVDLVYGTILGNIHDNNKLLGDKNND